MRDYYVVVKPALSSEIFIAEAAVSLRQLCLGTADRRAVDRLAKLAAQIAKTKLWGRLSAAAGAQGISVEQLALSVVGTLFHEPTPDSLLSTALKPDIDSDDFSLFLRFKAVVVRTAAQELFHRWHETDPTSAKLWRNLQRAVRHDRRLAVFPCDRPEWATLAGKTESTTELNYLEYSELASAAAICGCPSSGLADYIFNILTLCKQESGRQGAARIDTLFAALRDTISSEIQGGINARGTLSSLDPDIQMAVNQARAVALDDLRIRLDKYATDGKLPSVLTPAFEKALTDLLEDCVDGGPAQSYYDYLRPHSPGLREEEYRRTFRSRFEYLAEKLQETFFNDMRRQLEK